MSRHLLLDFDTRLYVLSTSGKEDGREVKLLSNGAARAVNETRELTIVTMKARLFFMTLTPAK